LFFLGIISLNIFTMTKTLLSLVVLAVMHQFVTAQCNPTIPNSSYVINSTQAIGFGGSNLWVCSGDTLTTNGGSNTVFLEVGAFLYANGGSNYVYVPKGAKIDLSSGANTIYYVDTTDIISAGGAPIINKCSSIAYDYTNAPAGGCTYTTGINQVSVENNISVYPNPSKGVFTIQWSVVSGQWSVEVYTMLGEKVYASLLPQTSRSQFGTGSKGALTDINLTGQPNGVYLLKIISSKEVITQKVILEK
jgi:Secretion system C-terminal sorting domain